MNASKILLLLSCGGILAVTCIAGLAIGPASLSVSDTLSALLGSGGETNLLIVWQVRLPRVILAVLIGGVLGLSGAVLQGFLRNPLAEPGLIGVSSAAALGAVVVFYSGLASMFAWALPLGGVAGALVAAVAVWQLAGRAGDTLTLILAGVAVTGFASALTALALNFAPNPFAASEIMFWLMGSLADRSFDHVWLALPFIAVGVLLLARVGPPLDALTLGEAAAASLGYDMGQIARRIILGTALTVGAATAVAGAIGFVGLVTPHLMRPLVGHRPAALLAPSAFAGAVLTLVADIVARVAAPAEELKLGVLTALLGAPFFLYLIYRHRRAEP